MSEPPIRFRATVLRKQADLPRYIIVKSEHVSGRTSAFTGDVSLNGTRAFSRNIRPWGKGSDAFFFNLTQPQCRAAGVETGDTCDVAITPRN